MKQQRRDATSTSLSPVQQRRDFVAHVLRQAQRQGGIALLVDGAAGVGKTYVLRALIDAALDAGHWRVGVLRADEVEMGEPYSFIERFAASGLVPNWRFVPNAQTSPVPVARECIERLMGEDDTPERVIVIDDAQWIDNESQRVIRYLIPRMHRRNVVFAFGVRAPHPPGSFGEFLADFVRESPQDAVLHVQPLTVPEIRSLVIERLGVGISERTAQRIFDATGGTFLGVDSVLSSLTSHEIARLHLAWDPPIVVAAPEHSLLLRQFVDLPPSVRATCEIVCLAGHGLTPSELAAAAKKLGEPVLLDEAVSAGVLSAHQFDSGTTARHALLAQAVVATISIERSRAVLQALAEVTTGHRSLRHTLLSTAEWNADLHARVDDFVWQAVQQGKLAIAAEMLRTALEIATAPAARISLLENLSLVHLRAKNSYLMLDLLDEIEQLPPSLFHDFLRIVLEVHKGVAEVSQESVLRLLSAPASSSDERALLAFYATLVVITSMRTASPDGVRALIDHATHLVKQSPREASELTDPRLSWMVAPEEYLLALDCYRVVQDQLSGDSERVKQALPILTRRIEEFPDCSAKVDAIVAIAGAHLSVGAAEAGYALAKAGVELLDRVSEPWAGSTVRLVFAHCLVLWGEYPAATELIELTQEVAYSALDVEARSSWAALRVTIAAIGATDDADAYVEQARYRHEITWEGYAPDLSLIAECDLARARGDHATVLEATSGVWATRLSNTQHGFLTYRAHALIDAGQLTEAATLIQQLGDWRGTKWFEYWGTLDWLHARLAEARGDTEAAQWHYEAAITQRLFPLPLGQTLADFGAFLLNHGQREEAEATLSSAAQTLAAIGAEAYLPRVRGLLAEAREGDGDQSTHLLHTLTDRERQIALQLAKGRSNSQIAESLIVSTATVRSHVSNVLRKLRLSSRGEVARLLRNTRVTESDNLHA